MKIEPIENGGETVGYIFMCPGCKMHHVVYTKNIRNNPVWEFNGDLEKPTFYPSILVTWPGTKNICHSFVKEGRIQFLSDCTHEFAGKTVELEEVVD